jgi:beta-lactamase superfamily II metal-dependent hydrolase
VLANSGSNQSTSDAWLAALNPRLRLISVGAGNPEGNPAPGGAGDDVIREKTTM